jgi:polyferredoxin
MPAFSLKNKRRALQIATALAFVLIPILNRNRYSLVYGNFLSFHMFGIPLADPLAVLQLTVKNYYLTVENVIGTLIALTVAFLLGTVFCSWVCPYGLLSEWTHQLSRTILSNPENPEIRPSTTSKRTWGYSRYPRHLRFFPLQEGTLFSTPLRGINSDVSDRGSKDTHADTGKVTEED